MRVALGLILVLCASALMAQTSRSPQEYVRLAMLRDQFVTLTCVRTLHRWNDDDCVRVRRDQASNGANKITVLSPLSKQGHTIVDDGRQWTSYDPDRELVVVQDSPIARVSKQEIEKRFEILKRNYVLSKEGVDRIAGRIAVRVALQPKADELVFSRRYWIDVDKFVLLRVEWTDPSGRSQVVSDTLSISFPESIPEETFKPKFLGRPETVRVEAPTRVDSVAALSREVGFQVVTPQRMPAGLTFTGADVIKGRRVTMAALRYTDGATNVTIYQTSAGKEPPWRVPPGGKSIKVGSVYIAVDGDLPEAGRDAVFKALAATAQEGEVVTWVKSGRDDGQPSKTSESCHRRTCDDTNRDNHPTQRQPTTPPRSRAPGL
jgi:negative regulator of sigma E activity